jgi:AraC family transcriptional regulator of adaptative response/methylated-DNA-[protein]-cysteine methyltransferase
MVNDNMLTLASDPEESASSIDEERWQAVVRRDGGQASGGFVYGVRTTGVYCRPGCASRLPRRENVRFFDSPLSAEQAGFRACQRCRPNAAAPNDVQAASILQACQLMRGPPVSARRASSGFSNRRWGSRRSSMPWSTGGTGCAAGWRRARR